MTTIVLGFPRSGTKVTKRLVEAIIGTELLGEPFNPFHAYRFKGMPEIVRGVAGTGEDPPQALRQAAEGLWASSACAGYKECFLVPFHTSAPDAQIVYVWRDPLAITAAWMLRFRYEAFDWYFDRLAERDPGYWEHLTQGHDSWSDRIAAGHRIRLEEDLAALPEGSFVVSFAELVANHEANVSRLIQFLQAGRVLPGVAEVVRDVIDCPYRPPTLSQELIQSVERVWRDGGVAWSSIRPAVQ